MATAYGPSIIRDGLVLALDAANPKSLLTSVEVLVVGGGGAGGGGIGGGGGGGGVIWMPAVTISPGTGYSIVVGAGGTPVVYPTISGSGGDSTAFGATAKGGGGSGCHDSGDGVAGGSGGGAASNNSRINQGGASTGNSLGSNSGFIYGNRGGNMLVARTGGPTAAAGGGGAGAAAADTNSNTVQSSAGNANGRGGDGILNSILGTPYYWGGGGGGGGYNNGFAGNGGLGGGGGGSNTVGGTSAGGGSALNSGSGAGPDTNGAAGGANTGGGGGGGAWQTTSGGAGGSGIVVVRYFGPQRATGGTITSVGGYTIHSFTTVGSTTFTPNATWSDLSGGNNNATLVNNPTYTLSERGYLTFLGTQMASFSAPALSSNTLEFVFYNTSGTDTYPTLYSQVGQNGASGFHWVYGFPSSETINVQYANGTSPVSMSYSSALPLNTYVHISIVSDLSAQTITCYRNGVSLGTTSTPGIKPIAASTGYIGTYQNDTSSSSYRLKGRVPYFKIYNIALTAAQVAQNFNALRGRYGV